MGTHVYLEMHFLGRPVGTHGTNVRFFNPLNAVRSHVCLMADLALADVETQGTAEGSLGEQMFREMMTISDPAVTRERANTTPEGIIPIHVFTETVHIKIILTRGNVRTRRAVQEIIRKKLNRIQIFVFRTRMMESLHNRGN